MISVEIFGRRAAAGLLAAGLLAAPALWRADGVMLVQTGAFWMGRDDGSPAAAPPPATTSSAFGAPRRRTWARWLPGAVHGERSWGIMAIQWGFSAGIGSSSSFSASA